MSLLLPTPLVAQARAKPHAKALIDGAQIFSFSELVCAVERLAAHLSAKGVRAGSTVALLGRPSQAFVVHIHALMWLGAELLPVPPTALKAEVQSLGRLCTVALAIALDAGGATQAQALGADCIDGVTDFAALPAATHAPEDLRLDAPIASIATSGTSGPAKLISLNVGAIFASAVAVATRIGHLPHDCWLLTLPLHHVGGLSIIWRAAFFGAATELVLPFNPERVQSRLASGGVTLSALVPTMLERVLDVWPHGCAVPKALRAVIIGGAPTPQHLARRALERDLPIAVSWGMTEAASQVATRFAGEDGDAGDVGPPLPFLHVSRADTHEALCVVGPQTGGKIITTRDRGSIEDGRVKVLGRIDDLIISGGENIAPEEIESALKEHPQIGDAGVVGANDAKWGQRPIAYVVLRGAAPAPDDEALRAFCRARLASFKIPTGFVWLRALPRDALGKLRRRALGVSCEP